MNDTKAQYDQGYTDGRQRVHPRCPDCSEVMWMSTIPVEGLPGLPVWECAGMSGAPLHPIHQIAIGPEYMRGYLNGECAREEAENGWDPSLDGGQW